MALTDAIPPPIGAPAKPKAPPVALTPATPEAALPEAQPIAPEPAPTGARVVQDTSTGQQFVEGHDGSIFLQDYKGGIHRIPAHEVAGLLGDQLGGWRPATPESIDAARKQQDWDNASLGAKVDWAGRRAIVGIADGLAPIVRGAAAAAYGAAGKASPIEENFSGEKLVQKFDEGVASLTNAAGITNYASPEAEAQKFADLERRMDQAAPIASAAIGIGGMLLGGELGAGGKLAEAAELGGKALGLTGEAAAKLASGIAKVTGPERAVESGATKLAQSLGLTGEKAARVGRYAEQVATGAGIGVTQGTDEAWINNEQLTAESQLGSLKMGALFGLGGAAAIDAVKGAGSMSRAAAERVFGSARRVSAVGDDAAAGELAEAITGSKPPEGFGRVLKGYGDWIRDKIEAAQAAKTGAKLEDIQRVGALRQTPEALEAQRLYENRDLHLEEGTRGLTDAIKELHGEGQEIYNEARDTALKKAHMKELLADSDHDAIMQAGRDKLEELQNGYSGLLDASGKGKRATGPAANETTMREGRSLLGSGKAIADIKAAYEDAIDGLASAKAPEDVTSTLDQFKRATQRAKVNAEQSARRVTSGIEMGQARARAELMEQVSSKTRDMLQDTDLFGKFGEAQRAVNSQFNAMLDSDRYVRQKIMEQTGQISSGPSFGATRFEVSPDKVRGFVDGLGTMRSQLLEGYLRDNIVARKRLAEEMVQHFDLGEHAAGLQKIVAAADKSLELLDGMQKTIGITNKIDAIKAAEAASKGHGAAGSVLAAMAGHAIAGVPGGALAAGVAKALSHVISSPGTLIDQAVAMRHLVARTQQRVTRSVGSALRMAEATAPVGRAARIVASRESDEHDQARFQKMVVALNELQTDPAKAVDAVSGMTAHVEHPGMQQALTTASMKAASFLASKIPPPLYQDARSSPKQLGNVSQGKRDQFMRYAHAVQNPMEFFADLGNGSASQEQAEVAQALTPGFFAQAQADAIKVFSEGKATGVYQQRLRVQRLLQVQLEPITSSALQQFIAGAAKQDQQPAQQAAPRSNGKSTAASSLNSPLDNLKL